MTGVEEGGDVEGVNGKLVGWVTFVTVMMCDGRRLSVWTTAVMRSDVLRHGRRYVRLWVLRLALRRCVCLESVGRVDIKCVDILDGPTGCLPVTHSTSSCL